MKLNIIVGMILILISVNQGFSQTVFTVTSTGDGGDSNPGNGVCDDGTGNCTLRAAIEEANAGAGKDTIAFNISGDGPHTIQPSTALPTITDAVVIDGYTQPGASPNTNPINLGSNAVLMIEIDGTNAGQNEQALAISAGNSMIRGLVINRFGGNGINISEIGGNIVEGNFIGTDITGTTALGNMYPGVEISSSNNIIGGTTAEARNVISGNLEDGLRLSPDATGNMVQGNFIGTDVTGMTALGNMWKGVDIASSNNIIGGTTPEARNVISGNLEDGIWFSPDATGNLVRGNLIGTDVTGTIALGNMWNGVYISSSNNIIGGTTPEARNIISGSSMFGIRIEGAGATGNLIQGNYIGTDVSGTFDLGNGNTGVFIWEGASSNTVGGLIEAANIIAFNADDGVEVGGVTSTGNLILSNSIFSNNQGFPIGTGLGIDLHPDGVRQANDPGDADTGPNNLQNYPEDMLFGVDVNGDLLIDYRVDSDPVNSTYPLTVQFFESFPGVIPSTLGEDQGEGKFFLGENVYTLTDFNSGIKTVNFGNAAGLGITNGEFIVATATDSDGNTSEFSFPTRVGIADIMVTPTYAAPGSEVVVKVLVASDTIGLTVVAEFESPDNTPIETLQLFDDGTHSDGSAGDGIFGNAWALPATEERNYFVDLQVTFDDTLNFEIDNAALFTSIGPVSYDSLDIRFNTGSILFLDLYLINHGITSTASNISAEISTADSCVADINSGLRSFGDIAAGATAKSSGAYSIDFSQNCDGDVLLTFDLAVSSDGIVFWSDSFEMQVVIVGVNDEITGLPTEYTLSEAYPNPFNPTTTIEYSLPQSGKVSLIIYNLLGQEVTKLVSSEMEAGHHEVTWDASNIASGVYLYRLQAGDFVQTRKMVLLK